MNLFCVGINHRTAPIEIREKLWFSNEETRSFLPALKERFAKECILISTCNRTELYYVPFEEGTNGQPLWKFMADHKQAGAIAGENNFYTLSSLNAVKHLFHVASGIDSMVLGDIQILHQIKEAYSLAQEHHTTGILLNRLIHTASHVGKRAKTETEISEGAVSMSYAAAELASKIFEDLSKRSAMLIGAGETGKLTAKHLCGRQLGKLYLANRTRKRAEDLVAQFGGTVIDFENIQSELKNVDIVISSVDSSSYILTAADISAIMKTRGTRPLFIIDIGVPRNIDPAANKIANVFLHDVDALNHIIDNNLSHRKSEIPKIKNIVLEEIVQFQNWYNSLEVNPTIQQLRDQLEGIRQSEVDKHKHHFAPEKQEEIDILTKRIINKILHTPMVNLKNGHGGEGGAETQHKVIILRHLFGLDKNKSNS